jgi:flagellar motor switch protein FliG
MSNLRKAAILLMSLPEEDAGLLLSKLDAKLVEQVSIEIARIHAISVQEQETAILEFARSNPASIASEGGLKVAESLVQRAMGKNAAGLLNNIRQSIEEMPFGFLQKVDSQNILTYINDEHPQTIALIVSYLPTSFGAEILAGLSAERQLAVVRRIANMGQTNPEIIEEVEAGLEKRMSSVMRQSFQRVGGVESVAEILNVTDRQTERALLESLAQEDPELVEEIRRRMFVFEDISRFSDKHIQSLLKHVESAQWATALKGASEGLRQKVFSNMSERAATLLKEEMDYLGPVRLSAVEQMQQQIVDIVRMLEDAGEIEVTSGEEEEQFVQ